MKAIKITSSVFLLLLCIIFFMNAPKETGRDRRQREFKEKVDGYVKDHTTKDGLLYINGYLY